MNAPSAPAPAERKAVSLVRLRAMLAAGEKVAMLTAYDASFARAADDAGVDCLLVGDSLGMVVQGGTSTVPVTLDEVAYHVRCVARGRRHAWLIADLPFGSYEESRAGAALQRGARPRGCPDGQARGRLGGGDGAVSHPARHRRL
ncbi:MAG: 3-methyl-2-oxobutanoate hydroxymethyltransferase, partial [Anaerolineales bacterium]|nr:3-methyl-2-oxobutanoate hydroxymethyltransferase [Anaerolineales bacterium]